MHHHRGVLTPNQRDEEFITLMGKKNQSQRQFFTFLIYAYFGQNFKVQMWSPNYFHGQCGWVAANAAQYHSRSDVADSS